MATSTTYHLGGYIPAAPQQNRAEQYDGAAGTFTSWDTAGVVISTRPLTPAEAAQLAAQDTAATASSNQATIQSRAQTALAANAAFLALGAPTNLQTVAQVQTLTREATALIKIALSLYADTAGT